MDQAAVGVGRHARIRLIRIAFEDGELGLSVVQEIVAVGEKFFGVGLDFDFFAAEGDGVSRFDLEAVVGGVVVVRRAGFLMRQLQFQVLASQLVENVLAFGRGAVPDHLDGAGLLRAGGIRFGYVEAGQIAFLMEFVAKRAGREDAHVGLRRRRRPARGGDGRLGVGFRRVGNEAAGRIQMHDDIGTENDAIDARKTLRLRFAAGPPRPAAAGGGSAAIRRTSMPWPRTSVGGWFWSSST